jgi:hypothetical protein
MCDAASLSVSSGAAANPLRRDDDLRERLERPRCASDSASLHLVRLGDIVPRPVLVLRVV